MESTFLAYGIPVLVSVISTIVGHWFGSRKSTSTPVATPVSPAAKVADPVMQAILSKLFSQAQSDGHAALDAIVAKLLPGAAPMMTAVDAVVSAVEKASVK